MDNFVCVVLCTGCARRCIQQITFVVHAGLAHRYSLFSGYTQNFLPLIITMKIICLQENLKSALSHLDRIASKNQSTPILTNLFLKADGSSITLFATDLELGMDMTIPCKTEKKGEVIVPIKLFSPLIQNLPHTKVSFEEKGNRLVVETDDTKTTLPLLNKDEFPLMPKVKPEHSIEINAGTLKTTLAQVLNSVATSYSIPEISGVLFLFEKDVLKIVSTDSFRLSEKTIFKKRNFTIQGTHSFILPQRTAQELVRVIDQEKAVLVHAEQNQILFKLENMNLVSRLITGTYPNYEQIIPKSAKTKITLNKTELASKVKLASIFSSKLNDVRFVIQSKKGICEVRSADEAKGEYVSVAHGEIRGENTDATFNHRYILDGLANIPEEEIMFELNGPASPAILAPLSNGYRYVVMPIKV